MRTLVEIIDDVDDGRRPEYDELRYALIVACRLATLNRLTITDRLRRAPSSELQNLFEEIFQRTLRALASVPREWLGPNNDPDNPECQARRRVSKAVCARVLSEVKP